MQSLILGSINEGKAVAIVRVIITTIASSNPSTPAPDAGSELFDEAVAPIAQEGRISFETPTILRRRLGSICRRADKEMSTIRVLVTGDFHLQAKHVNFV